MLAPPQDLLRSGLRTGVGFKVDRVKRAVGSYFHDRTQQAANTVTSHVTAYAMFAAAGIFLIAALLVGLTALFDWIEINYGLFQAFGVVCGLLLIIAAVCAAIAAARLRRRPAEFPSLGSRLRVAIKTSPTEAAAAALTASAALTPKRHPARTGPHADTRAPRSVPIGLVAAAVLVGLVAARHYPGRRTED
jgi:Putative Actinobacterial Holin-X, holin superfamily III